MEKKVLLTELIERGSHLRKEITPTAVVSNEGKYPAGTFWDANKTVNMIVNGAAESQDTIKELDEKVDSEISRATAAEQAITGNVYTKQEINEMFSNVVVFSEVNEEVVEEVVEETP